MNKDFAPFELAIKLKEKGFTKETAHHYNDKDEICVSLVGEEYPYPCPTIPEVLKWLREEKYLHIEILHIFSEETLWDFEVAHIGSYERWWNNSELLDNYEQAALAGVEYVLDNLI
jgi:hypothetical protein